ncbi:hypothetical protein N9042_00080 [bacterium]|nr:hypothetical protein [bacterium]
MGAYTTIDDPSAYFQTALYTGTGATRKTVTNDGNSDLQPDLFWFKRRDSAAAHVIADTNRGANVAGPVGYTITANPNSTATDVAEGKGIMTITSNGFTVEEQVHAAGNVNTGSMVCWQWKCNGGTEQATVSESGNNPGHTRQTNVTAGLSIIVYTGTGAAGTIAHGLGKAPEVLIVKNGGVAVDWAVYHRGMTDAGYTLALNNNDAQVDSGTNRWNHTAPTSSVVHVGTGQQTNQDTKSFLMYAFTSIQGYSKFGSYKGNGSGTADGTFDGPFIATGFKPAWLMIKRTSYSAGDGWTMYDNARTPRAGSTTYSNYIDNKIGADSTAAELGNVYDAVDFLSNGFKIRTGRAGTNANGSTYTYMAFAENPFVTSTGVPTTAR